MSWYFPSTWNKYFQTSNGFCVSNNECNRWLNARFPNDESRNMCNKWFQATCSGNFFLSSLRKVNFINWNQTSIILIGNFSSQITHYKFLKILNEFNQLGDSLNQPFNYKKKILILRS